MLEMLQYVLIELGLVPDISRRKAESLGCRYTIFQHWNSKVDWCGRSLLKKKSDSSMPYAACQQIHIHSDRFSCKGSTKNRVFSYG